VVKQSRAFEPVKSRATVLAILSLPAAAIGYVVSSAILSALSMPIGAAELVLLIVPLFVAGLCMIPFLVPFMDRMAKRDLEAHRAQMAAEHDPVKPDTPR
jgi:hypothetical protein